MAKTRKLTVPDFLEALKKITNANVSVGGRYPTWCEDAQVHYVTKASYAEIHRVANEANAAGLINLNRLYPESYELISRGGDD